MTNPQRYSMRTSEQLVAIVAVDAPNNMAYGLTRQQTQVTIDTRYLVGAVHVTPALGEQWYVKRRGMVWALDAKLPFNTDVLLNVADNPVQGQVQVGASGGSSGPLQLNGSVINANAPFSAQAVATTDRPDPASIPVGSHIYDATLGQPIWTNGTKWTDSLGNEV